jgi:hypothetical protein
VTAEFRILSRPFLEATASASDSSDMVWHFGYTRCDRRHFAAFYRGSLRAAKELAPVRQYAYKAGMPDKIFYPAAAIVAILLIALSFVWPQGQGMISPAPFGHKIELPDYFRMVRERSIRHAREAQHKADDARRQAAAQSSASASSASMANINH